MIERFSVLDAMFFSLRVAAQRPRHMLIYAGVWFGLMVLVYLAMTMTPLRDIVLNRFFEIMQQAQSGRIGAFFQMIVTIMAGYMVIGLFAMAGINRILVREDVSPAAPIQLGMDELRYVGVGAVFILMMIGLMLALMVLMFIFSLIFSSLILGLGQGLSTGATMISTIITLFLIQLPVFIMAIYVVGRLAPMFPMTTLHRRFRVDAWEATEGVDFHLLTANFLLALLTMIASFILQLLLMPLMAPSVQSTIVTTQADMEVLMRESMNPTGPALLASFILLAFQVASGLLMMGPAAYAALWSKDGPRPADPSAAKTQPGEGGDEA